MKFRNVCTRTIVAALLVMTASPTTAVWAKSADDIAKRQAHTADFLERAMGVVDQATHKAKGEQHATIIKAYTTMQEVRAELSNSESPYYKALWGTDGLGSQYAGTQMAIGKHGTGYIKLGTYNPDTVTRLNAAGNRNYLFASEGGGNLHFAVTPVYNSGLRTVEMLHDNAVNVTTADGEHIEIKGQMQRPGFIKRVLFRAKPTMKFSVTKF